MRRASELGRDSIDFIIHNRTTWRRIDNSGPFKAKGVACPGSQPRLKTACRRGHVHVVRLLLEAGADRDLHTKDGQQAFAAASANGHREIRHMLVAYLKRAVGTEDDDYDSDSDCEGRLEESDSDDD